MVHMKTLLFSQIITNEEVLDNRSKISDRYDIYVTNNTNNRIHIIKIYIT